MARLNTYLPSIKKVCFTLVLLQSSSNAFAGDKENSIINKAVQAYGGEQLLQLKSLTYQDKIKRFVTNQSGHFAQGDKVMHLSEYDVELTIDYHHQRAGLKRKTTLLVGNHDRVNQTISHQIYDGKQGFSIDHCLNEYRPSKRIDFNNVNGGFSQMLDTILIKQINDQKENAQWLDVAYIQGQAHDVLKIGEGTKQGYTVYLNQQSGYLTRMVKLRGKQLRSYDFLAHQKTQGIVWAKQLFVSNPEQAIYYSDSRHVNINNLSPSSFEVPTNYTQTVVDDFVDVSQLTIRELAQGVYFVGQGWGYTLFIDVGDYYISAGAWQETKQSQAWLKSLALLRTTTGNNKPIAQHIVTHHHMDHMAGLDDIIDQGANLVLHPNDIASVNSHLKQPLAQNRFIPIEESHSLAAGKVVLFDVPNSHASHNLVVYLPETKILFSEDMFGSSYQDKMHSPNGWPDMDTYQRLDTLVNKVQQQNYNVEQYVSSHHARILTQSDIDKALKTKCILE